MFYTQGARGINSETFRRRGQLLSSSPTTGPESAFCTKPAMFHKKQEHSTLLSEIAMQFVGVVYDARCENRAPCITVHWR